MARSSAYGFESGGDNWRDNAACLREDPELFFPVGSEKHESVKYQISLAKEVCARCVVINECLEYALTTGQNDGVWGGLSADERRALKRKNARERYTTSNR
jgi:WhiB family redox-sensing transcriptional regulator